MLIQFYLWAFIAICFGLLAWGLKRPTRVYEYPFFMSGIFIAFIAPQAFPLISNPGNLPPEAIERILLMSCLCAAMCWVGYQFKPNDKLIKKLDIPVNRTKLLHGGVAFVIIGYFFTFLVMSLSDITVAEGGGWTGIATVYVFFTSLAYVGFTMVFMHALRSPSVVNIVLTIFASVIPMYSIIAGGRRQPAATFIVAAGLTLYFNKGYVPPRGLVAAAVGFALIIIPLTGAYRSIAESGEWGQLQELKPVENLETYVAESENTELKNGAYLMEATASLDAYQYGTGLWDGVVFNFVPAQFLGRDFKDSLMFRPFQDFINRMPTLFAYDPIPGMTFTGVADAFLEFGYFGCLFFLVLGYFFKSLWASASAESSIVSQILYAGLFSPALITVTHGTYIFLPNLIFYFIFFGSVVWYAREKPLHATRHARMRPLVSRTELSRELKG